MKSTAPLLEKLSVIATAPCRGLNMLNTRFGQMSSSLANLESKIDVR